MYRWGGGQPAADLPVVKKMYGKHPGEQRKWCAKGSRPSTAKLNATVEVLRIEKCASDLSRNITSLHVAASCGMHDDSGNLRACMHSSDESMLHDQLRSMKTLLASRYSRSIKNKQIVGV